MGSERRQGLHPLPTQFAHEAPLAFSPDGRHLLAARQDEDSYTLQLYDTVTWQVLQVLPAPHFPGGVAFSLDGRRLAAGGRDGLRVHDAATGQLLADLHGHSGAVLAVAFSPDGRQLASCGEDKTVRIWNVQIGTESAILRGHLAPVTDLAFSPDGCRIASSSRDQTVKVWNPTRNSRGINQDKPAGVEKRIARRWFRKSGR